MVSPQTSTPTVRHSTGGDGVGGSERPIDRVVKTLRTGLLLAVATLVHVGALILAAVAATALIEPLPASGQFLVGVTLLFVGLTIVAAAPIVARRTLLTAKRLLDAQSSSPVN